MYVSLYNWFCSYYQDLFEWSKFYSYFERTSTSMTFFPTNQLFSDNYFFSMTENEALTDLFTDMDYG